MFFLDSDVPLLHDVLNFNERNICITDKLLIRDFLTTNFLNPSLNSSKDTDICFAILAVSVDIFFTVNSTS